jgi:hypothetical protein
MITTELCNELKRQTFLIVDPVLAEAETILDCDQFNSVQLMCLELIRSVEEFIATFQEETMQSC